jgi:hypothetical protein
MDTPGCRCGAGGDVPGSGVGLAVRHVIPPGRTARWFTLPLSGRSRSWATYLPTGAPQGRQPPAGSTLRRRSPPSSPCVRDGLSPASGMMTETPRPHRLEPARRPPDAIKEGHRRSTPRPGPPAAPAAAGSAGSGDAAGSIVAARSRQPLDRTFRRPVPHRYGLAANMESSSEDHRTRSASKRGAQALTALSMSPANALLTINSYQPQCKASKSLLKERKAFAQGR